MGKWKRGHFYPANLVAHAYYIVEVSYNRHNPVHHALLFTGFLSNGKPGNYSYITRPASDNSAVSDPQYLRVVSDPLVIDDLLGRLYQPEKENA